MAKINIFRLVRSRFSSIPYGCTSTSCRSGKIRPFFPCMPWIWGTNMPTCRSTFRAEPINTQHQHFGRSARTQLPVPQVTRGVSAHSSVRQCTSPGAQTLINRPLSLLRSQVATGDDEPRAPRPGQRAPSRREPPRCARGSARVRASSHARALALSRRVTTG